MLNTPLDPKTEETLLILNKLHRNKWRPDIVNLLLDEGPLRFNEIQRKLGISHKVLASNLKWLAAQKIVHREVFAEVPPHVEYSLTEIGKHLKPVHEEMRRWAKFYIEHQN